MRIYRLLLCSIILFSVGVAHTSIVVNPHLDNLNYALANVKTKTNEMTQRDHGFDVLISMYATKSEIILNIDKRGYNYSKDSKVRQTDNMISGIFEESRATLKELGIVRIRVLVNGEFFKLYSLDKEE